MKKDNTTIQQAKFSVYERLYQSFIQGTKRGFCHDANKWLAKKKLSVKKTGAGFNTSQIHVRCKNLVEDLLAIGFITMNRRVSKNATPGYVSFGGHQMIFPLRDKKNEVVNFCAMNCENDKTDFLNGEGIFPCFPDEKTKRVFVTDTTIEAATILESGMLKEDEAVIALFEGQIKKQHEEVFERMNDLQEVIYISTKE